MPEATAYRLRHRRTAPVYGLYRLGPEERELDSDALSDMLVGWAEHYPIVSIEDPLGEDDEAGLRNLPSLSGNCTRSLATIIPRHECPRVQHYAARGA